MRLLQRDAAEQLSLTRELIGNNIPKYAILSHTWGTETDEVTFHDLMNGTGVDKPGYEKIRLCGEQAARDGLEYFWVDTCCIDKTSSAVLSEAIISMFRWYRDAAKCYVYLADVLQPAFDINGRFNQLSYELAFQESRWFSRGWTLQELLAPRTVQFFSKNWEQLGDKKSLERVICRRTRIPLRALQGSPLSTFSVAERLSWAGTRETTREEDNAYSLLGIFNIHIPVLYGEGRENALKRLDEEIHKPPMGLDRLQPAPPPPSNGYNDVSRATPRRGTIQSFGNSGARGAGSGIKCFRCDNNHVLKDCYASSDTVLKARERRMKSKRCANCGSGKHWVAKCPWEGLV